MQIKVSGILNYRATPVEKGWEETLRAAGLEIPEPKPVELSDLMGNPPIEREKQLGDNLTKYGRWVDTNLLYASPNGQEAGVYVETLASHIDNPLVTYETVSFDKDGGWHIDLFFHSDGLYDIDYDNYSDQTVEEVLREILSKEGYDADIQDGEKHQKLIDKFSKVMQGKSHADMFKLFLDQLK